MPFTFDYEANTATLSLRDAVGVADAAEMWQMVKSTSARVLRVNAADCTGFDTSIAQLLMVCTRYFDAVEIAPSSEPVRDSLRRCGLLSELSPFVVAVED